MSRVVREWTLVREIGRGGMGVVWLARHQYMPGDWAVKVMRPELMDDQESRDRFLSEAMVLSTLHHPGIVGIQSPFIQDGQLYMPMEYLTGVSLDAALKASPGPWDVGRSLQIITQVADAVGYAHHRSPPVIHRDLKPLNIQLTDDGVAKVLDFGLARAIGDKSMTATGKAVGTPAYMSPEVLEGGKATPRSDIYSLGVILYRLLSGRLPYDLPDTESSLHAVFMAVIRGIDRGLPDVREFVPHLTPQLGGLTMRMLSRDPGDRPADGAELAQLLAMVWAMEQQAGGSANWSGGLSGARARATSDDVTRLGIDVTGARSAGVGRSNPMSAGVANVQHQAAVTNPGQAQSPAFVDADRSFIGIQFGVPGQSSTPLPQQASTVHGALDVHGKNDIDSKTHLGAVPRSRRKWWIVGAVGAVAAAVVASGVVYSTVGFRDEEVVAVRAPVTAPPIQVKEAPRADPSGTKWVLLPGGTFQMGSDNSQEDEKPAHTVTLSAFEIAATEVTVAQYRKCVEAGVCTYPDAKENCNYDQSDRENHPINCVDWNQAATYSNWVGGRLPTEAEWEYAARSGGRRQEYPWGDDTPGCDRAVAIEGQKGCGLSSTWPVCSKSAGNTEQGLCDMAGNVWEWVSDWSGVYPAGSVTDPTGPSWGSDRVNRGGAWSYRVGNLRSALRSKSKPGSRGGALGFRPVRDVR